MSETVLLTGATGFVGRELVARLAQTPDTRTICLVRAASDAEAVKRLNLTPDMEGRAGALAGDFTEPRLGLTQVRFDALAAEVTRIVHCGASVSWSLPLDEARRINTVGTRQVLDLAEAAVRRGVLRRFDHVSTCFVCGKRTGLIGEESLDGASGFNSTYEQSKFEAEQMVRARMGSIPSCVFRLPMVVGDSRTGHASSFKVMYWPLKMLSRGMVLAAPADPHGIVDMVPVDYACDAIESISRDPAQRGKTFHLAAGPGAACTIGDCLDLAVEALGVRKPLLVRPSLFFPLVRPLLHLLVWGKRREAMKKGRVYIPYLQHRAIFDTSQTRTALAPYKLEPPAVSLYFRKLVDYAVATDWGRRR